MKTLSFHKVVGSGNDFILLDLRKRSLQKNPSRFARNWCDRKRGVGADGLLLITSSKKADARMRIFNPDGSEAAMCGNGLRCVAWYLHVQDHGKKDFALETGAGLLETAIVSPQRVRIFFGPPKNLRLGLSVTFRGKRYHLHSVNTGVPHAVLLVPDREKMDLASLGKFIRFHRLFQPEGTNVDLMEIETPSLAAIRTYERGVEGETLACGTGAVACAVIGVALGRLKTPAQIITASGESLSIDLEEGTRQPWRRVSLEGQAQILFHGELRS